MPRPAPSLRILRRLLIVAACAAVIGALRLLAFVPAVVEQIYARRVGAWIARSLSGLSGLVPISLAELAIGALAIYLVVRGTAGAWQVIQRRRHVLHAIAGGVLHVLVLASLVALAFYVSWGMNYQRAPLATRLGWAPIAPPADAEANRRHADELAAIAEALVDAANAAYREAFAVDDLGRPSTPPGSFAVMDAAIEAAYPRVQARLGLEPAFGVGRARAKRLFSSEGLNHLTLGGFYFPWTGEANVNQAQPAPTLAQSIAHEKAHQRGIALEDEANFIGYLACATSDDPYVRYSGYLFAQRQLLNELVVRDAARARALIARRLPGVQRDVDFIREFWRRYDGTASRVSTAVNDRYLRSQGVARGVASYAASRNLIVLFARQHGAVR